MAERPRGARRKRPGTRAPGRDDGALRELVEFETAAEGSTAEPEGESGTLPGSVGGTTGTAGRTPGVQVPGASAPGFPGISPQRARRLRERKRRPDRDRGGSR